jgi:anti-anti-sigma factor
LALEGDTITIILAGAVDQASRDALEELIAHVVGFSPANVIVDLRALTSIDSSGVGELLVLRRALAEPTALALVHAPEHLDGVLAAAGLLEPLL